MNKSDLTKYCYDNEHASEWLEHLSSSHFSSEPLKVAIVENAIVLPDQGWFECFSGGVIREDKSIIASSFQRHGLNTVKELITKTDFNDVKAIDREVVYLGQYRRHYGSFLVDSISRLWYALDEPEKYTYVYLATQLEIGDSIHETAYRFLEHLGINRNQVLYIIEPTKFKKMIIPEMSFVPHIKWNKEFLDTVYKVVDDIGEVPIQTHDKIYFSRSKFSAQASSDFGEEFIVRFLEENGFFVVYPEEHNLEEQIYLVNHCKVFASIGGSCAHNIIFSKVKPQMILFNRMNGYQWHQWMFDEMAGVEPITYVDAYNEPLKKIFETTISGPYLYGINSNVKRFASDYHMKLPYVTRSEKAKSYMRYTLRVLRTAGFRFMKHLAMHTWKRI